MQLAFAAKAGGAAQLARRSSGLLPLASSTAFSSVAGLLGSAGQANYAAANAVLDAWASVQLGQGVAAVSMQWGAWGGAGMAEGPVLARLARLGMGAVQPAQGLAALQAVLRRGCSTSTAALLRAQQAGAVLLWERLLMGERAAMPFYAEHVLVEAVVSAPAALPAAKQQPAAPHAEPAAAGWSPDDLQATVTQAVAGIVGAQLGPQEALMNAGLDSLGAVELRKELARATGLAELPATLVFDYPSIAELTAALLGMMPAAPAAAAPAPAAPAKPARYQQQQQPGDFLAQQVMAAIKVVLGGDVGAEASLMTAGLDSLGAIELHKELAALTGLDLPSTLVFDYPTAEAITEHLASLLPPPAKPAAAEQPMQDSASELHRGVITAPALEDDYLAATQPRLRRAPPLNPNAPVLTKEQYFTVPPLRQLRRASDDQLKVCCCLGAVVCRCGNSSLEQLDHACMQAVERLVIGRKDAGEVAFIDPVDLRGLRLDDVVDIDKGRIQLYGLEGGALRPAPGSGLNKPALLTFKRMHVKQKDAKSIGRFKAKLADHAARLGGVFVHYDADAGIWIVKVDHF